MKAILFDVLALDALYLTRYIFIKHYAFSGVLIIQYYGKSKSIFHSKKGFTLKAILTGLIGVIIICAVEPYNAYYIGGTHTVGNHFPIAAIFLFLIIILIHLALKHLKQSYGYTPTELIIIWCMLIVVGAIPYSGLVRYLFPLIPAPVYFATPENEWKTSWCVISATG